MAVQDRPSLDERLQALFASEPAAMADPYTLFGELREAGPLYHYGPAVLVTRYADVKAIFRDDKRFSSSFYRTGSWAEQNRARLTEEQRVAFDDLADLDAMRMSATDADVHDRLRRIVHRGFTPRRIAELEKATRRYADQLLDALAEQEAPDLMEFAYRLPLMIIADLLGVPEADRETIHGWSDTIGRNRGGTEPGPLLAAHAAMKDFHAYIDEMLEEHRRDPQASDLVSALMGAEQDERLTPRELAVTFQMLLFAGHETTTNLLGIGALALLQNRDQWQRLCADPSGAPNAVEELLRFVTPVQHSSRVALVDVELAGETIARGTTVRLLTTSANRDPDVFEHPDRLDLTRANARDHLSLGFGLHFCLGSSLARLEGVRAFERLAIRFPDIELAADDFVWTGSATLRRLARLPVRLGPDRA